MFLSLIASLRAHASYWRTATGVTPLRTWGDGSERPARRRRWDHTALAQQARHDIAQIAPLLEGVLDPALLARLIDDLACSRCQLDDELWVRIVYAFLEATNRGTASIEHLADMFVPIYMWRAADSCRRPRIEPVDVVQTRLNALCDTFQRLKPALVSGWDGEV